MDPLSFIAGCVAGIVAIMGLLAIFAIVRPWVRIKTRGGKGSLAYVLYMRLRGNPVPLIIDAYTSLLHTGVVTTLREVESHYVANQSRIMIASDLVNSIRENPVETHVAVWIDNDDAEWLGNHFTEKAAAFWDQLELQDGQESQLDPELTTEAERLDRIGRAANTATIKIKRAEGRL